MTDKEKLDRIKELIKPFQKMEKNIDAYASAKTERQKEKAMVDGIEIREAMETNLKEIVTILYE